MDNQFIENGLKEEPKEEKKEEYHICKRCNKKMTIKDYDYMIDMAFENGGCSCACCLKTCGE